MWQPFMFVNLSPYRYEAIILNVLFSCHCPDGLECVREGANMELRYFYFKCRKLELSDADSISDDSSPVLDGASNVPSSRENARNLKRFGHVNEEL